MECKHQHTNQAGTKKSPHTKHKLHILIVTILYPHVIMWTVKCFFMLTTTSFILYQWLISPNISSVIDNRSLSYSITFLITCDFVPVISIIFHLLSISKTQAKANVHQNINGDGYQYIPIICWAWWPVYHVWIHFSILQWK